MLFRYSLNNSSIERVYQDFVQTFLKPTRLAPVAMERRVHCLMEGSPAARRRPLQKIKDLRSGNSCHRGGTEVTIDFSIDDACCR